MDVSDLASVRAVASELKGKPIDLLLNNARVGPSWSDNWKH